MANLVNPANAAVAILARQGKQACKNSGEGARPSHGRCRLDLSRTTRIHREPNNRLVVICLAASFCGSEDLIDSPTPEGPLPA